MKQKKIAVLLSTFNGQQWLPQLLDSLSKQTIAFELIWRDDGSVDDSVALVRAFEFENLTELKHSEESQNVGACASFGILMQAALSSSAEIFFFADQDDVWRPEKLERVAATFARLDNQCAHLVHHDLRVVDHAGREMSASLWRYMALIPAATELRYYLTRNSVTGCSAAFNRALLEAAYPMPVAANMHDWWLALVASAIGQITVITDCLVDYRQHGANALGAKSIVSGLNPFTNWREGWERGNAEYRSLFPQAKALQAALGDRLDDRDAETLATFINLARLPLLERVRTAHALGLRDRGSILWIVAMIRVAFNGNS